MVCWNSRAWERKLFSGCSYPWTHPARGPKTLHKKSLRSHQDQNRLAVAQSINPLFPVCLHTLTGARKGNCTCLKATTNTTNQWEESVNLWGIWSTYWEGTMAGNETEASCAPLTSIWPASRCNLLAARPWWHSAPHSKIAGIRSPPLC